MKKLSLILATVTMIFATSCKDNKKDGEMNKDGQTEMNANDTKMENSAMDDSAMDDSMDPKEVIVNLKGMKGSDITGKVIFTQEKQNGEVTMKATVKGLAEGSHAIHIHENADCSSMKAAGGHWNPTDEPHGKWGAEEGFHKGDIGNFEVNADGVGTISITTDQWCIGCDDANKNVIGHSIIVHEGVDDFVSQPSGAAGARMACGTIEM